jgi:PAS domain S-box-containing protein
MSERDSRLAGLSQAAVQQTLLMDAVDRGPALVFVADETMSYVAVNETACSALGYTRTEALGLRVSDVATEAEAPAEFDAMVRRARSEGVSLLRAKDGSFLQFTYRTAEVRVAGMPYFVAVGFAEPRRDARSA